MRASKKWGIALSVLFAIISLFYLMSAPLVYIPNFIYSLSFSLRIHSSILKGFFTIPTSFCPAALVNLKN